MTTIVLNSFVRRQTIDSPFAHWMIPDEELIERTLAGFEQAEQGYREGVLVVPIDPSSIFTAMVTLEEGDELVGAFVARVPGEQPRKKTYKKADENWTKPEAAAVDVILYASSTLAEDGDNDLPSEDGNWEIVSVNARPTVEKEPINPGTLMFNHFHVEGSNDGGTTTGMSDAEFVAALRESVAYWKDKAFIQG